MLVLLLRMLLLHHGSPELVPLNVVEEHLLGHGVLYALPDACKEVIKLILSSGIQGSSIYMVDHIYDHTIWPYIWPYNVRLNF